MDLEALRQRELAWAAGFFDGEGSSLLNKQPSGDYFELKVVQKDRRPLKRFREALGIGRVGSDGGDMLRWKAGGECALRAAELLYPYLSEPKREQMDAALEARTVPTHKRRKCI